MPAQTLKPEEYRITEEPCYEVVANEVDILEAAYRTQLTISQALTDDREMIAAVNELCASVF